MGDHIGRWIQPGEVELSGDNIVGGPGRFEWLFGHTGDTRDDVSSAAAALSDIGGSQHLPAVYRLKAFVSHKGPSVGCGHYVAHIRAAGEVGGEWVLFDDEKVVRADAASVAELKKFAYLYFFEKV